MPLHLLTRSALKTQFCCHLLLDASPDVTGWISAPMVPGSNGLAVSYRVIYLCACLLLLQGEKVSWLSWLYTQSQHRAGHRMGSR